MLRSEGADRGVGSGEPGDGVREGRPAVRRRLLHELELERAAGYGLARARAPAEPAAHLRLRLVVAVVVVVVDLRRGGRARAVVVLDGGVDEDLDPREERHVVLEHLAVALGSVVVLVQHQRNLHAVRAPLLERRPQVGQREVAVSRPGHEGHGGHHERLDVRYGRAVMVVMMMRLRRGGRRGRGGGARAVAEGAPAGFHRSGLRAAILRGHARLSPSSRRGDLVRVGEVPALVQRYPEEIFG